jgi:hypothetical protein
LEFLFPTRKRPGFEFSLFCRAVLASFRDIAMLWNVLQQRKRFCGYFHRFGWDYGEERKGDKGVIIK